MKRTKKVISAILCAVIMLTAFPVSTYASSGISHIGEYNSKEFSFVATYPTDFQARYTMPVIIWSGGTGSSSGDYVEIIEMLCEYGYRVVSFTDNLLYDGTVTSLAIDYIIEQNEDETSPLYGKVDTERIGACGYSLGGRNTVNAAAKDDRIKAIVYINGSTLAKERVALEIPAMFIGSENDDIMPPDQWVKPMYDICTGPSVYACVDDGTHASLYEYEEDFAFYITGWFYTWLYEDQETKEYFVNGGELSQDKIFIDYESKNYYSDYTGSHDMIKKVNTYISTVRKLIARYVAIAISIIVSYLALIIIIICLIVKNRKLKKQL